jgi:hypothetical protein
MVKAIVERGSRDLLAQREKLCTKQTYVDDDDDAPFDS